MFQVWSYGPNHKCPTHVPLHMMELWEVLQSEQESNPAQADGTSDKQFDSVAGNSTRKTMRLHGLVQKQEILILIDSRSSASFISKKLVDKLQYPTSTPAVQIMVGNGEKLTSDSVVPNFT